MMTIVSFFTLFWGIYIKTNHYFRFYVLEVWNCQWKEKSKW